MNVMLPLKEDTETTQATEPFRPYERLVKIRHYGLLGNRNRAEKIARAPAQLSGFKELNAQETTFPAGDLTAIDPPPLLCPHCGSNRMILLERRCRPAQAPPPASDSS